MKSACRKGGEGEGDGVDLAGGEQLVVVSEDLEGVEVDLFGCACDIAAGGLAGAGENRGTCLAHGGDLGVRQIALQQR